MQAVGQLVGLGADEPRLYLVDGPHELFQGHVLKLGEYFLHVAVNRFPECLAAAQDVLEKPGLGFVHSHGSPLSHRRQRQIVADAQLVEAVAGFVDHGEQGAVRAFPVVAGDSHVVVVEIGGERVGAQRIHAPLEVETHVLRQESGRPVLGLVGKIAGEEIVPDAP